jgi:hypothetical protein
MAQNPLDDVSRVVKDAAYVGVGLAMLVVQRLQVRRRELQKQLGELSEPALPGADDRLQRLESRLEAAEERVEATLDALEALLPSPAQDVSRQVRAAARGARDSARQQVRELVGRANGGATQS